jgi:predicted nucleic acid-binding protein
MIHLDTNFLVELVTAGSAGGQQVREWLVAGREVGTSAIAWSEFCNGPLSREQKDAAFAVLDRKIADFTWRDGEEAARLFNLSGRRPGSHPDCMIAASALAAGASIASRNAADFARFANHGVKLEPLE